MIAVLLCAGYATRLYPLTRDVPKPLLPVAGRPVLDYLMDPLASLEGLREIHLVTNERFYGHFETWHEGWFERLKAKDIRLIRHNDGSTADENRLGACADLKLVLDRVADTDGILVAAGDNIFRFDLQPLWSAFRQGPHHRIVTLPETDIGRLRKTGVPVFGEDDRVQAIAEKPDQPPSAWCCPPLYFLKPSAAQVLAAFLQTAGHADAPGHFIDYLCRRETVYAFRLKATRLDIGNKASYRRADRLLRSP
ncbi:MAG: nucleotidyltransferase family protein [Desulfosarcina sp.]|nr:nucleotidyltransferase family protein [Desulfobacterales bacterium]